MTEHEPTNAGQIRGQIHLVAALPPEAKPLIKHFHLKRSHESKSFPLYMNKENDVWLIVSGKGSLNCAAATNYLAGLNAHAPYAAWVNIGIAGHPTLPQGEIRLAHKVSHPCSPDAFYPTMNHNLCLETMELLSRDTPLPDYPEKTGIDMEAYAFCHNAKRFASAELIHCIKIISDNRQNPWPTIDIDAIPNLISQHSGPLKKCFEELLKLSCIESEQTQMPPYYAELSSRWSFSVSQEHQLKKLLTRWEISCANTSLFDAFDLETLDRKAFLSRLQEHLDASAPSL